MPLSNAQKEFIKSAISHFVEDVATDKTQLQALANKLKQSFQQTLLETDEIITLQKCIAHPAEYLQRLETFTTSQAKITLGEVQIEILNILTQLLLANAESYNTTLEELEWDTLSIKSFLEASPGFNKEFTSASSQFDTSDRPTQLSINTEGRAYEAFLILDNVILIIKLRVSIHLSDDRIIEKEIMFEDIPIFLAQNGDVNLQFDAYLRTLLPTASELAESTAAKIILKDLIEQDVIDELALYPASNYAKNLLTCQFYLDSIKHYEIFFEQIINLQRFQYDMLITTPIMSLLRNKICDIHLAKNIDVTTLKMLNNPTYYKLLFEKKVSLDLLEEITDTKSKLLTHPAVANLVGKNKLQLEKIKNISPLSVLVFSNEFFYIKILQNKMDPEFIIHLSDKQKKNLLKPEMIQLISNQDPTPLVINLITIPFYFRLFKNKRMTLGEIKDKSSEELSPLFNHQIKKLIAKNILTVDSALALTAQQIKIITCDRMNQLLIKYNISLAQVFSITSNTRDLIENDTTVFETLSKVDQAGPLNLIAWAAHINKRLSAFAQLNTGDQSNTLQKIKDDLEHIIQAHHFDKVQFLNKTNELFISNIKKTLINQPSSQAIILRRNILHQIELFEQTRNSRPEDALNHIAQLINQDSLRAPPNFFIPVANIKKLAIPEYSAAIQALKNRASLTLENC